MVNISSYSKAFGLVACLLFVGCGPVRFSADTKSLASVDPNNDGSDTNTPPDGTDNGSTKNMRYVGTVERAANKVDIVLVVDDSSSMAPDNAKLANRLSGFVTSLENSDIDWQMCVTVTRAVNTSSGYRWGASMFWQNYTPPAGTPQYILRSSASNLSTIFSSTMTYIGSGWANSDDERGIKSAYWHVYNGDLRYSNNSGCYRQDAALAYIFISDEDERSVGGDQSAVFYASEGNKPLENDDKPEVFIDWVKSTFGSNKRFTANSIIVIPGDTACMTSQDANGASKSHYGHTYARLSSLTGGGVGSICATDYAANLNLFLNRITNSLGSVPLECAPVGNVTVTISPNMGTVTSRVEGINLILTPAVPEGRTITVDYKCQQ